MIRHGALSCRIIRFRSGSRRLVIGLFCCLLIVANVSVYAGERQVRGKDRINGVGLLEDHSQALPRWARRGIGNAVLINFDAHDDMRRVSPEKIETLRSIARKKDWKSFEAADSGGENGLYHPGSFIHASCKLGIIRRVYWVIPFSYFRDIDATDRLEGFLAAYGFPRKSIDSFVMHEGCYQGIYDGFPLSICGIEHLPRIEEPVILSIDADFFPPFADWYDRDILSALSVFFIRVAEQNYRIRDAVVSCSVNGGFLNVARRWIADYCVEILEKPKFVSEPFPELWLVHGLADFYYRNDRTAAAIDFTRRFRQRYPKDPCLMTYQAFALMASGDREGAFDLARTAYRHDKRYAFALADLGQCLIDRGDLDEALEFFRAAYEAYPPMNFRQKNLADALMGAGRYREALHYYDIYRQRNGSFPAVFLMGKATMKLGEEGSAGNWFEQGVSCLKDERYVSIDCEIDASALREAVNFFERKNMHGKARIIVSHPSLKNIFEP